MQRYDLVKNKNKSLKPFLNSFIDSSSLSNLRENPFRQTKISKLPDDFYTTLLSWSNNRIAYAIQDQVFIYDFLLNQKSLIARVPDTVTSVGLSSDTCFVGCSDGSLQIININTNNFRSLQCHHSRIGTLIVNDGNIYTGSRDRSVKHFDIRCNKPVIIPTDHNQEVCGLALNTFLATGGNDNTVCIVDLRSHNVISMKSAHHAAVRALCWSQTQPNVLYTGGGTADKRIKKWCINFTNKNKWGCLHNEMVGSQVCNLYATKKDELIVTFGYAQNDSRIYDRKFNVIQVDRGHKNRVIHFCVSGDEQFYLTGSSDEVVNVWRIGNEKFEDYRM